MYSDYQQVVSERSWLIIWNQWLWFMKSWLHVFMNRRIEYFCHKMNFVLIIVWCMDMELVVNYMVLWNFLFLIRSKKFVLPNYHGLWITVFFFIPQTFVISHGRRTNFFWSPEHFMKKAHMDFCFLELAHYTT